MLEWRQLEFIDHPLHSRSSSIQTLSIGLLNKDGWIHDHRVKWLTKMRISWEFVCSASFGFQIVHLEIWIQIMIYVNRSSRHLLSAVTKNVLVHLFLVDKLLFCRRFSFLFFLFLSNTTSDAIKILLLIYRFKRATWIVKRFPINKLQIVFFQSSFFVSFERGFAFIRILDGQRIKHVWLLH